MELPYALVIKISSSTSLIAPRSGELRTQKLKSYLVRTQSLNVLPLKPGVGQFIAMLRLLPGISSLLISTLLVHSPAFFFQNIFRFLLCWLWLTHGSCVGPQNKIGHPVGCRSRVGCPRNINRLSKQNMTCGMMTREMNNLETE